MIVNELVDDARKSKKELVLFKVDFEKSYDSVAWRFSGEVMTKMNFPLRWRQWILECVSTTTASVLLNGSPTAKFKMERGLRQGDPLSPSIFLFVVEGLNVMMNSLVDNDLFYGYTVGARESVSVFHLQFADDTLLVGVKSWANVRALKVVLLLFEEIPRLKVNFHKSMLFGVNVADSWLHEAALVMNYKHGWLSFVYLGLKMVGILESLTFGIH